MATPYPPQNPTPGNPYASQGGYAPNGNQYAPYSAQNGAYAQPAHGQQAPGQPVAGYGAPQPYAPAPQGYPPPAGPVCRVCGAAPAAAMTIRQHTGLLLAMRFSKMQGPLCRSCGVAIHRDMTTKTLAGGWWSPVSLIFFGWATLLWNLFIHFRLTRLPQPSPSPSGVVLDPGRPIFRRPAAYIPIALPVLWLALYFWNQSSSSY